MNTIHFIFYMLYTVRRTAYEHWAIIIFIIGIWHTNIGHWTYKIILIHNVKKPKASEFWISITNTVYINIVSFGSKWNSFRVVSILVTKWRMKDNRIVSGHYYHHYYNIFITNQPFFFRFGSDEFIPTVDVRLYVMNVGPTTHSDSFKIEINPYQCSDAQYTWNPHNNLITNWITE